MIGREGPVAVAERHSANRFDATDRLLLLLLLLSTGCDRRVAVASIRECSTLIREWFNRFNATDRMLVLLLLINPLLLLLLLIWNYDLLPLSLSLLLIDWTDRSIKRLNSEHENYDESIDAANQSMLLISSFLPTAKRKQNRSSAPLKNRVNRASITVITALVACFSVCP